MGAFAEALAHPYKVFAKWRGEFFRVVYRGRDGVERVVPSPFGHYYADPFAWEQDGRVWLIVEDYFYPTRRASIAAIALDDRLAACPARTVLRPAVHASFPFLFRHAGRTFMIPEVSRGGGIDLYECAAFPDRWSLRRRLLDGVNAADTVIFAHDGRWWLITSIADSDASKRRLAVYHADDPVNGDWRPHPVNGERLYANAPKGTGRNAGSVVVHDGRLYRPMQKSRDYYAQGMAMMEIAVLSPTAWREVPAALPHPLVDIAARPNVHHVTEAGGVTVWDERVRY